MPALLTILFGAGVVLSSSWALGSVVLRRLPLPFEVRAGAGAVLLSMFVFGLLTAGAGLWPFWLLAGAVLPAARWAHPKPLVEVPSAPLTRAERAAAWLLFGSFGVFYLVNAAAPEIAPDGITYHLGLAAEYARTGAFPDRIAFYEMVPQGMEMLFTAAFSVGRHSAAKLVEFGIFVLTLPLLLRISRRLGLPDLAALVAGACYFLAPVVGVTGTTSYNDAGQVFFALAAFYLLLAWHHTGDRRYLALAGALAGFCYAIKLPGIIVPALAGAWLLWRREWKGALWFTLAAAAVIAPWVLRSLILTGNPFAPLLNSWFPNPYFHIATDHSLARDLRSLHGIPWWRVPWDLALGGGFSGIYGPWILALPLAPLALRRAAGRVCLALALLLAIPWLTNTSARFVMLGIPFAALALGMALAQLSRRMAWAAIALQAGFCFPAIIGLYEPFYGFRLHEFPLRAALRLEPESAYLANHLDDYKVVRMLERNTPADARILALMSVATAYTARDVTVTWQSADADRLLDTLRVGGLYGSDPFFDVAARWPLERLRAVRVRLTREHDAEWCIHEMELYSGADRVPNSPRWTLTASPNESEAPFALDQNLATRWRTWEPMRRGMYFEIDLDTPQPLSSVSFSSHTPVFGVAFEVEGQSPDGQWKQLSGAAVATRRPSEDLRRAAGYAVRRAGFGYLLAPTGPEGNGPLGDAIAGHESEWGVDRVGAAGNVYLFRVR